MGNLQKVFLYLATLIVIVATSSFAFGILTSINGGSVTASSGFITINEYGQYWFNVGGYFMNLKTALNNFAVSFINMVGDFTAGFNRDFASSNWINYLLLIVNILITMINIAIYPFRCVVLFLGLFLALLGWDLSASNWFISLIEFLSVETLPYVSYLPGV